MSPAVLFEKIFALHGCLTRVAAWTVESPFLHGEHLHQHAGNTARCSKLAAILPHGTGESCEEVIVETAHHVHKAVADIDQLNRTDHVDQLSDGSLAGVA